MNTATYHSSAPENRSIVEPALLCSIGAMLSVFTLVVVGCGIGDAWNVRGISPWYMNSLLVLSGIVTVLLIASSFEWVIHSFKIDYFWNGQLACWLEDYGVKWRALSWIAFVATLVVTLGRKAFLEIPDFHASLNYTFTIAVWGLTISWPILGVCIATDAGDDESDDWEVLFADTAGTITAGLTILAVILLIVLNFIRWYGGEALIPIGWSAAVSWIVNGSVLLAVALSVTLLVWIWQSKST